MHPSASAHYPQFTGEESPIYQTGSGSKTVHGNFLSATQTGSGDLTVYGDVAGNVQQKGSGDLTINGSVVGNVDQMGSGDIHISGDVYGNISQMGSSDIKVGGIVYGTVKKMGCGDINIRGVVHKKGSNNVASGTRPSCPIVNVNVFRNNSSIPNLENSFSEILRIAKRRDSLDSTSNRKANELKKDDKFSLSGDDDNELQCPICFEIPGKEVYQCKNGHMICDSCCLKVEECPQCRVNLRVHGALIRNRLAESLVAKIQSSCPFSGDGCHVKGNREQVEAHKNDCQYKDGCSSSS